MQSHPERRLWRWYRSLYLVTQIALAFVVFFVSCTLCFLIGPPFVQGFDRGLNQPVVTTRDTTPISNTGPRMGGQLAAFVNAYGSPASTTLDSATFTGNGVQITALANASHIVNHISVSGSPAWTVDFSVAFCSRFLPDGAQQTNRIDGANVFIDYSSSMGQIVLQAQMTTCLLFIAPS